MSSYRPGSPLRDKSPLIRRPADQGHAPLRNSPQRLKPQYNEEEEYERRRAQEFKKQFQSEDRD